MSGEKSIEAYDRLMEACIRKNIPFVCFRLPDQPEFQTWIIESERIQMFEEIGDVADRSGFVYAPFHRKTNFPVILLEPETIIHNYDIPAGLTERIESLDPLYPDYNLSPPKETIKSVYLSQATDLISRIDEKLIKAVLSRVEHIGIDETFNTGRFFVTLQQTYPGAFCHLIHIPGTGTWCGASPEMLLRTDRQVIKTVALAGTKTSSYENQTKAWETKELDEQNIVTKYIKETLQKNYIPDFIIEPAQAISAGNVAHLSTVISFQRSRLSGNIAAFINELHPTPAVCGYPKDEALNLIISTEQHNREYYAGYCGLINWNNKTDLFVNLRCMKIFKQMVVLYLGGGLTKGSKPEREWDETVLKAQTLKSILADNSIR